MRRSRLIFLLCALGGVLADTANAAEPLPASDNFERPGTSPSAAWLTAGVGTVEIQAGVGANGSQGLHLNANDGQRTNAEFRVIAGYESVVWAELEADLIPFAASATEPSLAGSTSVAFYLGHDEHPRVRDGDAWVALTPTLTPGALHRYTVRIDFDTQTWKLWVDGDLASGTLAFAAPGAIISHVRVTVGDAGASFLDNLRVQRAAPDGLFGLWGYADWHQNIVWPINSDDSPTGDPDGDGWSNLLEYGFGSNPLMAESHSFERFVASGDGFRYTYRRNKDADDLRFRILYSDNLRDWSEYRPCSSQVSIQPIATDEDEISVQLPASEDRAFFRLEVTSGQN